MTSMKNLVPAGVVLLFLVVFGPILLSNPLTRESVLLLLAIVASVVVVAGIATLVFWTSSRY